MFDRASRFLASAAFLFLLSLLSAPAGAQIAVGGDAGEVSPADPASWKGYTPVQLGCNPGKTGTVTVAGGSSILSSTAYLGYAAGATGTVTLTGAGTKWNGGPVVVGRLGTGVLELDAGAQLTGYGDLGEQAGSVGTATITGAGSTWTNNCMIFYAGLYGNGNLAVQAGGQVSTVKSYLGYYAGSSGTATVAGAGSRWTNSDCLYVGYDGSGTLAVSDGGLVSATTLYASLGDLSGNGTITATQGAVLDADMVFDAAHHLANTIPFGAGGTLNLTVAGGDLGAGYKGTGSIRIADGIAAASTNGYLGYYPGSTGTATITGSGSKWTTTYSYIGYSGSGTLNVQAGGQCKSGESSIGGGAGSTGTATITGAGSQWISGWNLTIGGAGSGSLTVGSGGYVGSSGEGFIGRSSGTTGTATVTGAGSQWTNSGGLYVGFYGSGNLAVQAGGQVSSSYYSYLGYYPNSAGTATVTGAGSRWTNSGELYVGNSGSGKLIVSDGGLVTATTLYASLGDLSGNGTITATQGAVLDADMAFDAAHGLTNAIPFGTGGTLNVTAASGGTLGAGYKGTGSLRIADGIVAASSTGYLGYRPGSTGTATVTGAGSQWALSGNLCVGYSGSGTLNVQAGGKVSSNGSLYVGSSSGGTLNIQAGGKVSNNTGYLGYYTSGSTGTATITGAGSQWTNSGELYVGYYYGAGKLTVADGGLVTATTLYASLSDLSGNGTITATQGAVLDGDIVFDAAHGLTDTIPFGTGGALKVTAAPGGTLGAGYKGTGSLRIADGILAGSSTGYLGYHLGSTGAATVTGGSWWINSGDLYVGKDGSGTLNIQAGGIVCNNNGFVGSSYDQYATGTATVTGAGSVWENQGTLSIGRYEGSGYSGSGGTLTVGNGGAVWATSLIIDSASVSSMNLHVSGDGMIVLGSASSAGSITTGYSDKIYADAFLTAGTYRPISAYPGKTITWNGSWFNGYGGTWNSSTHTFTVAAATTSGSGIPNALASGERLLITESASGKRVGASFGGVPAGTTFKADLLGGSDLDGLMATIPDDQSVLGAWNFTTNLTYGQVLLSFEIGAGFDDLAVWRYNGSTWSAFAAPDLTYGDDGIANFAVTSFSGYALTVAAHGGDANKDGAVDVKDLGILAKNYDTASGATWSLGNFNGDGAVDVTDLGILATNYDWTSAPAGAVPEPATLSLLALGGLALLRRRAIQR